MNHQIPGNCPIHFTGGHSNTETLAQAINLFCFSCVTCKIARQFLEWIDCLGALLPWCLVLCCASACLVSQIFGSHQAWKDDLFWSNKPSDWRWCQLALLCSIQTFHYSHLCCHLNAKEKRNPQAIAVTSPINHIEFPWTAFTIDHIRGNQKSDSDTSEDAQLQRGSYSRKDSTIRRVEERSGIARPANHLAW